MHEAEKYLRDPNNPNSLYVRYGGHKRRLFINPDGVIGIVRRGCKKSGVEFSDWHNITKICVKSATDQVAKERRMVAKYMREAALATYTNHFIRKCLNADWEKSVYENRLTTGTRIDGEIITLDAIAKYAPMEVSMFRASLRDKRSYTSQRFNFRGYDGSLSVQIVQTDTEFVKKGDVVGYFNKEYKGTGNGYYYLLINENKFIGYDID